jgi:hypothetical protein
MWVFRTLLLLGKWVVESHPGQSYLLTMARDRHENHRTFGAVQGRQVDCQLTLDC